MFSATDVTNFLACRHTATLERAESRKEIKKPFFNDPAIDFLREHRNHRDNSGVRDVLVFSGPSRKRQGYSCKDETETRDSGRESWPECLPGSAVGCRLSGDQAAAASWPGISPKIYLYFIRTV